MRVTGLGAEVSATWSGRTRFAQTGAALALAVATGGLVVALPAAAPVPVGMVALAIAATAAPGVRAETVRGAGLGLVGLAVLNGIPGVDLSGRIGLAGAKIQDGAVVLLVVMLAAWQLEAAGARKWSSTRRWLTLWCLGFGVWWIFTLVRTVVADDASLVQSALFGRDFLYFAVLVPLLMGVRLTPRMTAAFGGVIGAGVCVFGFAEIVSSLRLADLSGITHANIEVVTGGVVRIYASMGDAVNLGLALALGAALLASEDRVRRVGVPALVLLLVAFLLQLTRASYLGVFVSGGVVVAWWMAKAPPVWRGAVRRRVAAVAAGATLLLGGALVLVPGTADNPVIGAVASRVQTGIQNVDQSSGNVGYRQDVYRTMLQILGPDWPGGLGFVHPDSHYFAALPAGSIRNSDVGLLNVLMTMGAVGLGLFMAGFVYVLVRLLDKVRSLGPRETWPAILVFGASVWVLSTLLTSVTLVTLFSVNGLVLTAFVLRGVVAAVDDELA